MKVTSTYLACAALALTSAACGEPQLAAALNEPGNGGTVSTSDPPGTGGSQADQPQPATGGTAADPAGENGGSPALTGSGDPVSAGPYAPRSGSFRMLVYSRTTGFR